MLAASQNLSDSALEDVLIPLNEVGAAASVYDEAETYFFSTDGDTFTNYEREANGGFDTPTSFEEEYDDSGYDLNSIGAAVGVGNQIVLFNQNGTQFQTFNPDNDSFADVSNFPLQFGNGSSPISAVGAAYYRAESSQYYFFNREGTKYTIYNGGTFTAAFDISDLGDIEF